MSVYRIKPLAWKDYADGSICKLNIAMLHAIALGDGKAEWWAIVQNYVAQRMKAKSLDEAKQAAESWYRNKLLEALEEVT